MDFSQLTPDILKNILGMSSQQPTAQAEPQAPMPLPQMVPNTIPSTVQAPPSLPSPSPINEDGLKGDAAAAKDKQDDEDAGEINGKKPPVSSPTSDLMAKYQQLQANPTPNAPRMSDTIGALLGNQSKELEDAKKQRDISQLVATLGKAGSLVGAGAAGHGVKPETEAFDQLFKVASQPVEDVQKKAQLQQEGLKTAEIKENLKRDMEKGDPNSAISRAGQDVLRKLMPSIKNVENISLASQEKLLPGIERYVSHLDAQALAKSNAANKQAEKATHEQDQALLKTKQMLESVRGDPEAGQALKDRYAAGKALKLINSQYDPNNLSKEQVGLLVSEVAKIAQGGSPSLTELQALSPDTMRGKLGSAASFLLNRPTPQKAGEFVKQYKKYLEELNQGAQDVVEKKFGRVIRTAKKSIGDDYYNQLNEEYLKPFETEGKKDTSSKEPAIQAFMQANGIKDHDQAVKILKDNGKL